jgi:predicted nucleotidyltransferase
MHIAERFAPERVVPFRSHARGDAGEESDVDLMVS